MNYKIRNWLTFSEEILANETGKPADGEPVRKFAVAARARQPLCRPLQRRIFRCS